MKHLGDFDAASVLYTKFTTYRPSTGAPFTLAGTPVVSIYKDGSLTQSTAGITLTVDFDGLTGLHHLAIDTSADGTFYSAGSHFEAVITTGTVDSVSVVGSCVASFSIRKDSALKATVAGRTLDVSAGGEAGIDWANIGSPTTAVNLSATNIDVDQVVASVSGAVGSVTGAVGSVTGNVGGNVNGSVASVAANGISASSLAADAGTEIGTAVWATTTRELTSGANIVLAKGTGVTGFNDLDAAGVRGAVGLASANLDTQIATLATGANLATVAGYLDTEIAAILADTNELQTDWADGGRLDLILDARASQASVDTIDGIVDSILVDTAEIGAAGAGLTALASAANLATLTGYVDTEVAAIKATTDKLDATLELSSDGQIFTAAALQNAPSSGSGLDAAGVRAAVGLASANLDTQLAAIDDAVDTEVAAIKATTDKLDATLENSSDGWIFTAPALQQVPAVSVPSAADVADAVWDEPIAPHAAVSGSTAEALNAAGASGDPWVAALPGSYSAGQAGYILGTNLDATVSSRASATDLATVAGYVDTEVAAIKAVTDKLDGTLELSSDGQIFTAAALQNAPTSSGGLDAAGVRAAIGLASANLDTQLADLPTNAELSTALASSDDAVLAVLGTPAGASLAADVAAVQSDTNDIQSRLPAALVSGRIDASVGAMANNVMTAAAAAADLTTELQSGLATSAALSSLDAKVDVVDGVVDSILVDTAEIGVAGAGLTALATAANLATVAGYLDTEIAAILADTNELQTDWTNGGRLDLLVDAIKAKTDALPASPAAVSDIPTAGAIADAVHDEVVEGTVTLRQSIRLHNSALGGKVTGLDTFNPVFRDLADSKDVIDATVDSYGNRSAVTRDLT